MTETTVGHFMVFCCGVGEHTGLKDVDGTLVCVGQKVSYTDKFKDRYNEGIVCFGEYKQDGSSGEYRASACLGFYIQRTKTILHNWETEDDLDWIVKDWENTVSILEASEIKVLT